MSRLHKRSSARILAFGTVAGVICAAIALVSSKRAHRQDRYGGEAGAAEQPSAEIASPSDLERRAEALRNRWKQMPSPPASGADEVAPPRSPGRGAAQEASNAAALLPPQEVEPAMIAAREKSIAAEGERFGELQRTWEAEQEDPASTARMKQYIGSALSDLLVDGELVQASCRSTLCKLELQFDTLEEAGRFRHEAGDGETALAIKLEQREGGGLTVQAYLPRQEQKQ